MIFFLNSFFTFVPLILSKDIRVIREKSYDTIIWDGDCRKINAYNSTVKNACICKKKLEQNGVTSEIHGFFYRIDGHPFPTCLYDFRETGKWNLLVYQFKLQISGETSDKFATQTEHFKIVHAF